MAEEGESTENWALRKPGFLGSIRQLTCCARCGETLRKHRNEPCHVAHVFKPTLHFLCDACFDALPADGDAPEGSGGETK